MSQGRCPNCGAAVKLVAEQTQATCAYCGSAVGNADAERFYREISNSRTGGTYQLAELAFGSGKYAEALGYYNKIIEHDETVAEAWLGKAFCTLRTFWCPTTGSGFGDDDAEAAERDIEVATVIIPCQTAINCASNPEAIKKRLAKEVSLFLADRLRVQNKGLILIGSPGHGLGDRQESKLIGLALQADPNSEFVARTAVGCAKAAQKNLKEMECSLVEEEAEAQEEASEAIGDSDEIEDEKRDREETRKELEEQRRLIVERKAFWKLKQAEYLKALGAIIPNAAQEYLREVQEPKQTSKFKAKSQPRGQEKTESGGFLGKIKKIFGQSK